MSVFDKEMTCHQVEWRKGNIETADWGSQNGKMHEWILPRKDWEQGLWKGVRCNSNQSLKMYLKDTKVQMHLGVNNLKSSWMLCANLYFPFRATEEGRRLLAGFLNRYIDSSIESVEGVELEYAEDNASSLHPSALLGEHGGGRGAGQTSPDIAFLVNSGRGLILTENKFVEHSFYPCSARRPVGSKSRPGNLGPERCVDPMAVLTDPSAQCQQVAWGRRYWNHLAPIINLEMLGSLRTCPAAYAGYQLFRQQALAEGIAESGKYDLVVSALAIDERNKTLQNCLKSTGIQNIRDWGELFHGKARFAVFTHQQWVSWVTNNDTKGQWNNWLDYVSVRYGL